MSLYHKIMQLYPNLTDSDFASLSGPIVLQNDADDKGDYIKSWTHPDYPQPTEEQLAGIE